MAIKEDISIVKLDISNLHKTFISLPKSTEMLKFVHLNILLIIKTSLCIFHVNYARIVSNKFDVYHSSYWCTVVPGTSKYCVNWRFFYFQEGKFYHSTQLIMSCLPSNVDFLWESVDWARKKCLLSILTGFPIKWVDFRENVRDFPRDKEKWVSTKQGPTEFAPFLQTGLAQSWILEKVLKFAQ